MEYSAGQYTVVLIDYDRKPQDRVVKQESFATLQQAHAYGRSVANTVAAAKGLLISGNIAKDTLAVHGRRKGNGPFYGVQVIRGAFDTRMW
jgi:hypothetical protein